MVMPGKDAELDRFIFDAGLQVSLFANTVNIYLPIIYSSIYKDYIQSVLEKKGRFWKTVSFNIDISELPSSENKPGIRLLMATGNQIKYLQYNELDKVKWDVCINKASNGLIYGYSFYLDNMAKHWDALVLNDYEQ